MAKQKLRWEYPQKIFTVVALPSEVARAHEPVTRPLVLRNCYCGYNEQGALIKTLYCTHSQRFFTHEKDGWHERLPCTNRVRRGKSNKSAKSGGAFDTEYLRIPNLCLTINCYRLIADVWCEWPEEAKTDPEWYKHFEVDHLNGDHSDSNPENLRWVTPSQNRAWDKRCGREQYKDGAHKGKTLRGIGLQPKWIYYRNLRGISSLSDEQFEYFLVGVKEIMDIDPSPLSIEAINFDVAQILDDIYQLDRSTMTEEMIQSKIIKN